MAPSQFWLTLCMWSQARRAGSENLPRAGLAAQNGPFRSQRFPATPNDLNRVHFRPSFVAPLPDCRDLPRTVGRALCSDTVMSVF
ncbi:hypothetical protein BKA60DRAFT_587058 [Fusarium oxysporum]|nr:hypothetical protein BKA60DRAFT_589600 [Fusarium oxysporum]KAH7187840.1 hypothetical protein BKA60DRAFT_587058 [Fusarium oxysporum]